MSINVILFDLDGTLLPMDQELFTKAYFKGLATRLAPRGYEPQELIKAIWAGTKAMIQNTGEQSNEAVFWKTFTALLGPRALEDQPYFDAFYQKDFDQVQAVCGHDRRAAETVASLKAQGYRLALATNPLFPAIATEKRIRWAGLDKTDFELFTTYENSSFCKPNPDYFRAVAARLGVQPEECLMVGNDVDDDMVAETLGMKVFLLTDCLINKNQADLSAYPHGSYPELLEYIKQS